MNPRSLHSRQLNTGAEIPLLGFGTYLISEGEAATAVAEALRAGYRHIDTAEGYGNERGVGQAIRQATDAGHLTRDELFVTTKLWPGNPAWGDPAKGRAETLASLEASLERLGLDYVDLYLIHAPFGADKRLEQWSALVEAQQAGLARAVGVSNFGIEHLDQIRAAGLPTPAADQLELHPWAQKPALVGYLNSHQIVPIAYSSLVPLSTWRADPGQDSAKTAAMRADGDRPDSAFKVIAAKYGVTEAQLLLRWGIQQDFPVIPKSTDPARIRANADLFGFSIDDADLAAIAAMNRDDAVAWAMGDPTAG